jgi:hypothetical protein
MANMLIILRRIIYWTATSERTYFVASLFTVQVCESCWITVETEGAN